MKKTINGRRYDTEAPTTTRVAAQTGESRFNARYWHEVLYHTGRGRWFVVGTGGEWSRFGGASDVVVPLTNAEARAWLEEAGEAFAIGHYFGSEVENG